MENMSNMHGTLGPGVGEVEKWNTFFLSAKRDHLLSASPLILIKEFIELRCFSKGIEGHALISFLRENWNDDFCLCVFSASSELEKKAGTKQKNPPCLLPLPQAGDRVFLLTRFVPPCPLVKQHGIQHEAVTAPGARTTGDRPVLLPWWLSQNRGHKSLRRKEGTATGDSAMSHCSSDSPFFRTLPQLLLQVLFQPLVCQLLLCTVANFWGVCGTQNKWHWIYYGEPCW